MDGDGEYEKYYRRDGSVHFNPEQDQSAKMREENLLYGTICLLGFNNHPYSVAQFF